ncbi:MAG: Aspartate aminotransferase (EC [uncultured Campylobacterales bacterium]|uniref:Aspartate aminotransferase (EC) n=1 Tax=uncultured Campylobacterales bacterium TaxID=352960 RepID=A0A6S6SEX3_9BACT|nr:MAG: Aspartate aminotransferase (EC [uncultured Campylobacterales bacterium]
MFDVECNTLKRLPAYIFAIIGEQKMKLRREGHDVIDFSMGNPDGPTPKKIIDKLTECVQDPKTHGYSASKGILSLRKAIGRWYDKKYDVKFDVDKEIIVTMGSKEGYVHLVQAITNPGDVAVVPSPAYPIHSRAFVINGANVIKMPLAWDNEYSLDTEKFFEDLKRAFENTLPKPKYVVVNFPHNPTTVTVEKSFYERLVALAKKENFYIISDIAYADLTFDGYKTPSIFEVEGAIEVAVESFTLSKSYNMAGWRIGFSVGNPKLIGSLQKIKSWLDYGTFTPLQVASIMALDNCDDEVKEITKQYKDRRDVLIESFARAGWEIPKPKASMFVWAKLPEKCQSMGSLEFSKELLQIAHIAVSPGIGFGEQGDGYVRIALIENPKRIRQAAVNLKNYLNNK